MTIKSVDNPDLDLTIGEIELMTEPMRDKLLEFAKSRGDSEDMRLIRQCTHVRMVRDRNGNLNIQFGMPEQRA